MASRKRVKLKLSEISSRKVHIRTSQPYHFAIRSSDRGLIVRPESKGEFWKLHSAVIGKIQSIYPHEQPGLLGHVTRQLAILPDRTTLIRLAEVLRGRKPTEIRNFSTHLAIVEAYFMLLDHRQALRERLQAQKTVPWHET